MEDIIQEQKAHSTKKQKKHPKDNMMITTK